mgnify:CR=1 FL=1|jgi:hypothetical protein
MNAAALPQTSHVLSQPPTPTRATENNKHFLLTPEEICKKKFTTVALTALIFGIFITFIGALTMAISTIAGAYIIGAGGACLILFMACIARAKLFCSNDN